MGVGFFWGSLPSLKFKLDHFNWRPGATGNRRQLSGPIFRSFCTGTPRHVEELSQAPFGLSIGAKDISLQRSLHWMENLYDGVASRITVG